MRNKKNNRNGKNGKIAAEQLLEFLKEQKNLEEIASAFHIQIEKPEQVVKLLPKKIDGYTLVDFRNEAGEKVYLYRKVDLDPVTTEKKIWTPIFSKTDDSVIICRFPDDLDWREIRIGQIAEAHLGTNLFDEKRFDSYIKWIAKNPYVFAILNGAILGLPPKGKKEDKEHLTFLREETLVNKLRPIAHKILWAHQGCTEEMMTKLFDYDPLETVCNHLGIPYFIRPVSAEIVWKKHQFSFFCIHGKTMAQKRGTMLNAIHKLLESLDSIDFIIMSHPRAGYADPVVRFEVDMKTFDLLTRYNHLILTPGFCFYEGSADEKKGDQIRPPGSTACMLYADGRKGLSQ